MNAAVFGISKFIKPRKESVLIMWFKEWFQVTKKKKTLKVYSEHGYKKTNVS